MDCQLVIRREGSEENCKLPRFIELRKCLMKLIISDDVTTPSSQFKNQRMADHVVVCCLALTQ